MLIEWTLLNEFETPIKRGDFRCKTIHKLRQKQFNILTWFLRPPHYNGGT